MCLVLHLVVSYSGALSTSSATLRASGEEDTDLPLEGCVQGCYNDRLPQIGHLFTELHCVWKLETARGKQSHEWQLIRNKILCSITNFGHNGFEGKLWFCQSVELIYLQTVLHQFQ